MYVWYITDQRLVLRELSYEKKGVCQKPLRLRTALTLFTHRIRAYI